jgi:hypothetical protein
MVLEQHSGGAGEFGTQVFFIQPNSVIQRTMVAQLIFQEYEVYLVASVSSAKKVLAKHPVALAFLNIDEGLSEEGWQTFVKEVHADPTFKGVRLGILTYNTDPLLAHVYLMELQVPCGFVKLSLGLVESTKTILSLLEANEARGRRRFLRVHCGDNAVLNFVSGAGMVEGQLVDISIVALSCTLNPERHWPNHSVIDSIQLKLRGTHCLVRGIVMGSRNVATGERVYVVVFDPKTVTDHEREKIRSYMQVALQSRVEAEIRE